MMSNTKQMVGYMEIQHFRGNKLTQNAFFLQDFPFERTIPFSRTFVCLSIFQMFECFFPNQVSIQMFAAVSVLGWLSIIL